MRQARPCPSQPQRELVRGGGVVCLPSCPQLRYALLRAFLSTPGAARGSRSLITKEVQFQRSSLTGPSVVTDVLKFETGFCCAVVTRLTTFSYFLGTHIASRASAGGRVFQGPSDIAPEARPTYLSKRLLFSLYLSTRHHEAEELSLPVCLFAQALRSRSPRCRNAVATCLFRRS